MAYLSKLQEKLINYGVAFTNRINVREFIGTEVYRIVESQLTKAEIELIDIIRREIFNKDELDRIKLLIVNQKDKDSRSEADLQLDLQILDKISKE